MQEFYPEDGGYCGWCGKELGGHPCPDCLKFVQELTLEGVRKIVTENELNGIMSRLLGSSVPIRLRKRTIEKIIGCPVKHEDRDEDLMKKIQAVWQEGILYVCPNDCEDAWFHRYGTAEVTQHLTETGEEIELDTFDFIPKEGEPVRCRKCNAEAVVKRRKIIITEETVG